MAETGKPTWAARLPGGLAPEAWEFLHSLPHDRFLWSYDIDGTAAHVKGLEAAKIFTSEETAELIAELEDMRDRPYLVEDSDEDVHSAIERVLVERLGPLGANVHAGRSRNDQVATALRLWARDAVTQVTGAVSALVDVLLRRAEENVGILAPGYTHLQRAQPVTLGHWLCAHAHAFVRDLDRLECAYRAADVSPLGAGALAGNTLGIDPRVPARAMRFARPFANSLDAVSDRDFLLDAAYACSTALIHLSRLSEEVVLWSSAEFGFALLPNAYATGSSMMPQKKNPDVAELARGQTGVAVGALMGLFVTLKSLPLAYDRDLQADKEMMRDLFLSTTKAFRAAAGLVAALDFDIDKLAAAAADETMQATDLAEALSARGVPFRDAHERIATLVRRALDKNQTLGEALREDAGLVEPLSAEEAIELIDPYGAIKRRGSPGGPGPASVRAQIRRLRKAL
ncbi:MAG: argininosuccinate lyase [Actinomycetota bacterium]